MLRLFVAGGGGGGGIAWNRLHAKSQQSIRGPPGIYWMYGALRSVVYEHCTTAYRTHKDMTCGIMVITLEAPL